MSTILVSILNFCLETLPDCEWIEYMRLCKEREEDASPWFEIEAVCIVIFTGEFVLRILASPEGERNKGGVVAFCKNGANIIDFVAIVPWYISRVGGEAPGFLSLLRIIRAPACPQGGRSSRSSSVRRSRRIPLCVSWLRAASAASHPMMLRASRPRRRCARCCARLPAPTCCVRAAVQVSRASRASSR